MQRAMEIAAKNQIDLGRVDPSDEGHQVTHDATRSWATVPLEARLAASVLRHFFGVAVITRNGGKYGQSDIVIVGRKSDVEIGLYVFGFLVGNFRRCWNGRPNQRLKNRAAFMQGLYKGLCAKLAQARKSMPSDHLKAISVSHSNYINEYLGKVTEKRLYKPEREALAARVAGWREGQNTNIRPAMNNAQAQAGCLLG